jgi:predicted nicotinamide N-methyase
VLLHEQPEGAADGCRTLTVGLVPLRGDHRRGGPGAHKRGTRCVSSRGVCITDAAPGCRAHACAQVKSQRFFYDAVPPGHPGIGIVRPTSSQRLRFGDFGRRLAPSGEVLAWLVAKGAWNLAGKRVLELGSGLGLPGMACAAWTGCESVLLSDGDPELVEVLRANLALNQQAGAFGDPAPDAASGRHVQATILDWVEGGNVEEGIFDVILCADCVYDVELHIPLLMTLRRYLRPDGKVILIASPRGGSLNIFLHAARGFFGSVTCTVDYDEAVSSKFRGQNCFPQLVTLETLDCNRAAMEDFSVLEDEHAKRFVERRRRALQAEEEQMKQTRCRLRVRPALRATALSNNELNSMIDRMMNPKIRGARRPGAGIGEGDEQAPGNATDDLYLPRSQAVQPAAQSSRPSTGGPVSGRIVQGNRDPDNIRALRETVQEALLEQKNKSRNITSLESGDSVSEQKPHPEDKLEYQSSRPMQPIHRGRIYYKCDDQEESNTTAAFYKHLQDKPQRPINPTWVMTTGFRSRAVGRARGLSDKANTKQNLNITVKSTSGNATANRVCACLRVRGFAIVFTYLPCDWQLQRCRLFISRRGKDNKRPFYRRRLSFRSVASNLFSDLCSPCLAPHSRTLFLFPFLHVLSD